MSAVYTEIPLTITIQHGPAQPFPQPLSVPNHLGISVFLSGGFNVTHAARTHSLIPSGYLHRKVECSW